MRDRAPAQRAHPWLVALIALGCAAPVLWNDFVYDDAAIIRDDDRLHSFANATQVFTRPYWPPPFVEQLWRPLTSMLLMLQHVVSGGSPAVMHAVSVGLHVGACLLVYQLLCRFVTAGPALGGAALFAVHPVHVEAVAQAVNQAELLVAIATLAGSLLYMRAKDRGTIGWRPAAAIAGCLGVAVFAKESGVALVAILGILELLTPLRHRATRAAVSGRCWILVVVVLVVWIASRGAVLGGAPFSAVAAGALRDFGLSDRILVMLGVVPTWLRLLSWPAHLQAEYPQPPGGFGFGISQALGAVLVCGAAFVAWRHRRSAPAISFGLLWCTAALFPVSNLIPTGIVLAERTLYLPSVGFVVALATTGHRLWTSVPAIRGARESIIAIGAAILLLGAIKSINRASLWDSRHMVVVPIAPSASP